MVAIPITPRQRRTEIEQRLTQLRQSAPRLRVFGTAGDSTIASVSKIERLNSALIDLGPVFAAFGSYLATRADLFERADRREMAQIDKAATPLSAASVWQIVSEGLANQETTDGAPIHLSALDDVPFDARWSFQRHYGTLSNGEEAIVRIVRPCRSSAFDLESLDLLEPFIAPRMSDERLFVRCVDEFRAHYAAETDAVRLADALETLRTEASDGGSFIVPRIYRDVSTARVLVLARLPGRRLNDWLARDSATDDPAESPEPRSGNATTQRAPSGDLARLICEVWLRQSFDDGLVGVNVRPENLTVLSHQRISIDEGVFISLPQQTRDNLLKYLIAVAVDDPSLALNCLLNEFEGTRRKDSGEQLDRLFRQLVPDRTDEESTCSSGPLLAATVLAQWKTVVDRGYRPLRHVVPALRGLITLGETLRPLAPERDVLLDGLKDFRIAKMIADFHGIADPMFWFGRMDRILAVMISAPKKVDDVLSVLGAESTGHSQAAPRDGRTSGSSLSWVMPGLMLMLLMLVSERYTTRALATEWKEPLSAFLFLVLGGLLLKGIIAFGRLR
jgi:predicted unusual protein kinase regulating ubiquinone biosynthesis (AarF/ABC1/UbiB family)